MTAIERVWDRLAVSRGEVSSSASGRWVPTAGTITSEDLVNGDFTAFQCGNRSEEWAHFAVRTSE